MQVAIVTEGGKDIGLGHITRCLALSEAFRELGASPQWVVYGDASTEYLLKGSGRFQRFDWLKEKEKLQTILLKTDIAIVDSYRADFSFYKSLSKVVRVPVYMDDFNRFSYPKGVVVNGAPAAQSLAYPENKHITYLLGATYIPLRREFWQVTEKKINVDINNILFVFGNNDSVRILPDIAGVVDEVFPGSVKNIVLGRRMQGENGLQRRQMRNAKLFYNVNAQIMRRLMQKADMVISAGGQVLHELAAVGVPAVAMAVAENQAGNIRGWQELGFLEYIGWWQDDALLSNLREKIMGLRTTEIRIKKSLIGRNISDGNGAKRIAEFLMGKFITPIIG